jgi:hypothetical protein
LLLKEREMDNDLSKLRAKLEREMIGDARSFFREAILGFPSDWKASLWKLDMAVSLGVAWYVGKLLGTKTAFIEPEVIEEWKKQNEDSTNGRAR